jgi:hypothetical protein
MELRWWCPTKPSSSSFFPVLQQKFIHRHYSKRGELCCTSEIWREVLRVAEVWPPADDGDE